MTEQDNKMRLDQILIDEGLINDEQIKEALQYQKKHGGKLGSLLMQLGHVDEAGLVAALARQYDCDSVVLTDLEINELIVKFIPERIAVARRVMPFDYDPDQNVLMVASIDPTDSYLVDELNFVARGKKVKLYVAVEGALKNAIEHHYGVELQLTGEVEIIDENSAVDKEALRYQSETEPPIPGSVLLVGVDENEHRVLESFFGLAEKRVDVVCSAEEFAVRLDCHAYDQALIKRINEDSEVRLIRQLRAQSPKIRIQSFDNVTDLLGGESGSENPVDLLVENLDLFVMMLASKDKLQVNRSALVGRYADQVCQRLGLDGQARGVITSAAYLHDLARYYYDAAGVPDYPRTVCDLTIKLLKSLNYSDEVIAVLDSMYLPLEGKSEHPASVTTIGGNIVTAVSTACDIIPVTDNIPTDKFAQVRNCLDEMVNREITKEVGEALLALLEEDMLAEKSDDRFSHVLVLGGDTEAVSLVMARLKKEGYHPATETNLESFVGLFQRGKPDMMLIIDSVEFETVEQLVNEMGVRGVDLSLVPTFVLADPLSGVNLGGLLDSGVEDIMPSGENWDLLVAKMNRIRTRAIFDSQQIKLPNLHEPDADTHGHLRDMNLIDLLQTLGPNRKTVRLLVQSSLGKLEMYLREGNIISACGDDKSGVEAIYEGISWTDGTWTIYSLRNSDLPKQNVYCTYQKILLEGCRQLDESTRIEIPRVETPRVETPSSEE